VRLFGNSASFNLWLRAGEVNYVGKESCLGGIGGYEFFGGIVYFLTLI
jgi:hypothetical protein